MPGWRERNPADLGIALVELLAYSGDQLSYYQDAVATEAYLGTARQRISVRRHARLVDYRMHDGATPGPGCISRWGTRSWRRRGRCSHPDLPPAARPSGATGSGDRPRGPPVRLHPALRGAVAFETAARLKAEPINNEIRLHTWGDLDCCLPRGATVAYLYVESGGKAVRPKLQAGDYLLFEEVKGRATPA